MPNRQGWQISTFPKANQHMEEKLSAFRTYRFDYIAPNSSTSVFVHGYGNQQAVNYSAIVWGGSAPGVPNPLARVNLTQGETFRHVDGTVARKVYVQNLAPFNPCTVDVLEQREAF